MPLTQANRFISVNTVLGEDVLLLQSFRGTEGISRLFEFELDLLTERTDVKPEQLLGTAATFRVGLGNTSRYFNGLISRLVFDGYYEKMVRYRATVVPWLWLLSRTTDCRIFQNKTVVEIITAALKASAFGEFSLSIARTYPPLEYCVQYRESAFAFVSRLMEEHGLFYYFKHSNGKHVLCIVDGPQSLSKLPHYESGIKFRALQTHSGNEGEAITEWSSSDEIQAGKASLVDFDEESPKSSMLVDKVRTPTGNRPLVEIERTLEQYDNPGLSTSLPKPDKVRDEIEYQAAIRMQMLGTMRTVIRGQASSRGLAAGYKFGFIEHPNSNECGEYLATAVTHVARGEELHTGQGGAAASYDCWFSAIPAAQAFRAPRMTPKPVIPGPQTAFVVGPGGSELHCDRFGRVKVQFHWDRTGKFDENSSAFIRVAQVWAGKGWGAVFMPRVGQEVVVEFLEGNPDRPLITGRVYNADSMPPYALPDNATISTVKSNTSQGGGGFNEFRFEDKKDSEMVFLHAQKDLDIRVKHDEHHLTDNERHEIVTKDFFHKTGGDHHHNVVGDWNNKSGQNFSLQAAQEMHHKAGTNMAAEAGSNVHIKGGMNVVIEAGTSLTIKAGSNFINIGPSGVAIQGTMVLINSGGAAGAGAGCSPTSPTDPTEPAKAEPGEKDELPPPPPPPPPPPQVYSPAAVVLKEAAKSGTPFCEVCAREAAEEQQSAGSGGAGSSGSPPPTA